MTIRENMSKAESDISDAKHNINKLEANLVKGVEKIENTISKGNKKYDKKSNYKHYWNKSFHDIPEVLTTFEVAQF